MRLAGLLLFTCLFSVALFSQENNGSNSDVAKKVDPTDVVEVRDTDEESFSKAVAVNDAYLRIDALKKFLTEYPESGLLTRASELLASARATAADIELRGDTPEKGVALFKLAVMEAPVPPSDDLFSKVLVNIPTNLFLLGKRDSAFELAELIEAKAAGNPKQLLRLATFYISIKYATGTRHLAQKAIEVDPSDPLAYQTLGAANRLGFDLNGAEQAYSKALELQPDSLAARQYLGEMKRALGQPEAAEKLFREIIEKEPTDLPARTGLILSLFDQNRRKEAEELYAKEVAENPSNSFVMIGAANWYVAHGEPDLALESGSSALAVDPTATWAYIAMSRAQMKKNDPVEAEKFLLAALKYGSSPTLSYELALVRSALGFYFEAAKALKEYVRVENGVFVTDLDGRIGVEAENLSDLVSLERKNAIFAPADAYEPASAAQLRSLLLFEDAVAQGTNDDESLSAKVDAFIGEADKMQTFRGLYAATRLLDFNKLPAKAQEIAQTSVSGIEESVNVENASAPVMAEQLYEGRRAAEGLGRILLLPVVEKTTLVKILRGRIEDISARSLIAKDDYKAAEVRLKRAASVFPKDSVWWRSSLWRLGSVYEKLENDQLALDNYVASYTNGDPTLEKRETIEAVYTRIHGSLAGLDQLLETKKKPEPSAASMFVKAPPKQEENAVQIEETNEKPAETAVVTESALKEDVDLSLVSRPAETVVVTEPVLKEDVDLSFVSRPAEKTAADDVKPPEADVKLPESETSEDKSAALPADIKLVPALDPSKAIVDEVLKSASDTGILPTDADSTTATQVPKAEVTSEPAIDQKTDDTKVPDLELKSVEPENKPDTDVSDVSKPAEEVAAETKQLDQTITKEDSNPAQENTDAFPKSNATRKFRVIGQSTTLPPETPSDTAKKSEPEPAGVKNENPAPPDEKPLADENKIEPEKIAGDKKETEEIKTGDTVPEAPVTAKTDAEIVSEKTDKALIDLVASRPRFVLQEKIKPKPEGPAVKACAVVSSQDSISIIANGGSLGIVVGVVDYEKAYVMRAHSDSPKDVAIIYEPDIGSVDGRAFFVIKSVSEKKGTYNVVFETPCGEKSVTVEVH